MGGRPSLARAHEPEGRSWISLSTTISPNLSIRWIRSKPCSGSDDRFSCERAEDGDVHFSFKASRGETAGYFSFREELPALLFTLGF